MKSTPHECEKETALYLLVGDKLDTKKLLVVLECLKDRQRRLFTFVHHYCRARINFLKLSCFLKPYFHRM